MLLLVGLMLKSGEGLKKKAKSLLIWVGNSRIKETAVMICVRSDGTVVDVLADSLLHSDHSNQLLLMYLQK